MDFQWIEELKKSPIFNMSLSSKELFHSNFLAWICETYPKEMGAYFIEILGLTDSSQIVCLQREKHNIDLSFEIGDTLVLIENKVKSIAYNEQLEKYITEPKKFGSKAKNIRYILLSLKEFNVDNVQQWQYLSYAELLKQLEILANSISDSYHTFLIKDYICFINLLEKNISKQIDIKTTQIANLYEKNTDENILLKKLTDIRMHDFFLKGLFENITNELIHKVESELKIKINTTKALEAPNDSISIGFGMTRAQGLLDIKYKFNDVYIGVQIQGEQYRQNLEGKDKKLIKSIADNLLNKNKWFNFKQYYNPDIYPKNENKVFNQFDTNESIFLYRSVKFKNLSNDELLEIILQDILDMKNILQSDTIKKG